MRSTRYNNSREDECNNNEIVLRARALQERTERLQATVAILAKDLKFQSEESRKRREEQLEREKKLKEDERMREELMERRREQRRERQFTRAASTPQHYSTSTYNRFDRSRGYERSHLHDYERTSSTSLPPSSSLPALARRADHERVTSTMRTMGRNTNRPNSSPPSSVTNSNDTHRNRDRERNNERDRARQHADDIDAPGDDNLFPLTAGELGVGARANGGLEANGGVGLVQVEDAVEPGWRKPTAQELIDTPEQYCPILCRETSQWVVTSCGHYFDEESFATWLSQPDSVESCPMCRKPFRSFDKKAQREIAHNLVLSYLSYIGGQYKRLWAQDHSQIIQKFWDSIPQHDITQLCKEYKTKEGVNISLALQQLLEPSLQAYYVRLHNAVFDIVLRDVKMNLTYIIPSCYRSQLNKENTVYIAYSLTKLVPEFHIKWWKNTFLSIIYESVEELFLSILCAAEYS